MYKKIFPLSSGSFIYLPLVVSFIIILINISSRGTGYWYDEIITTEISKQPLNQLFETIKAEPHPPLFYLMLKLLPVDNQALTRLTITLISFVLMIFTIFYGIRSGVIERHRLKLGIILFLSSPFWYEVATGVKQDSITVPIFILAILVSLNYLTKSNKSSLWLLALTSLVTLGFGYITFAKVFILLITIAIIKPSQKFLAPITLLLFVAFAYFFVYGQDQFANNLGRFSWQQDQYRSLISSFTKAVGGYLNTKDFIFIADGFFIASLFLISKYKKSKADNLMLAVYFGITVLYYFVFGVARTRYIPEVFVLYFAFVGWGLSDIVSQSGSKINSVIGIACIFYFLNGLMNFYRTNESFISYKIQNQTIGNLVGEHKTGIIDRHPIESFIRKQGYFRDNLNAIPISPFRPLKQDKYITNELLSLDGNFVPLPQLQILENLKATEINRFIYIVTDTVFWGDFKLYYDPNQDVLKVLDRYCPKKDLRFLQYKFIVIFDGCSTDYYNQNVSSNVYKID